MKQFLTVAVALACSVSVTRAQGTSVKPTTPLPKGWHLLDKEKDGVYGISLDKAYEFVRSKNLKGKTVVVAVIDSGIDTLHEDLKEILWVNPKEIPGNGIDDDKNGYIDDVHGWNFIGGKDGKNVKVDSYEGARVYHKLKTKYNNKSIDTTKLSADEKAEYQMWLKAKANIEGSDEDEGVDMVMLKRAYENCVKADSTLKIEMAKDIYTGKDLEKFAPATVEGKKSKAMLLGLFKGNNMMETTNKEFVEGFGEYVSGEERKKEAAEKIPENYRGNITKDNEADINDRFYGNNDVMANTPFHGTHVSGIIAAKRDNNKGIQGIADNVRIMSIRAVPDGDEHDKDVALAIRYAVDNGAKVINMSFGKSFSPEKKWVDEAVKYAETKGVLLVHAAGNDAKDVDTYDNFPNASLKAFKTKASNWITVGASGDPRSGGITASFSNYGKQEVDVFAPGVKIYSTVPGGTTYGDAQGTSMASPVVAGTAAFLLTYFPDLTPQQIKFAIEKSAQMPDIKVSKPGTTETVELSDISKTGGLLNAYEAAKVAATLKPEKKKKQALPKSTLKPSKKG
ncbi:MAG: S8 family peptidase [Flavihumibacter sp.]|nr:S8 family peptidase [Flavihumibacter sp.]